MKTLIIDYTNHKGERSERRIVPGGIWHGVTPWHPEAQWLLTAWDVAKQDRRDFALATIHAMRDGGEVASGT